MSIKPMMPSVRAQEAEEEEELVDPQETLKAKCSEDKHCKSYKEIYDKCNDRVNSRSQTTETCTEELFDYLHCVDHCVSSKLFSLLK